MSQNSAVYLHTPMQIRSRKHALCEKAVVQHRQSFRTIRACCHFVSKLFRSRIYELFPRPNVIELTKFVSKLPTGLYAEGSISREWTRMNANQTRRAVRSSPHSRLFAFIRGHHRLGFQKMPRNYHTVVTKLPRKLPTRIAFALVNSRPDARGACVTSPEFWHTLTILEKCDKINPLENLRGLRAHNRGAFANRCDKSPCVTANSPHATIINPHNA